MGVDHLRNPVQEIAKLMRRVDRLEKQSPLGHSSVGRGGIRVYDGGVITIENGGLKVIGWIDVDGEIRVAGILRGDGEIVWTGPASFSGDTEVGGDFNVTGATTLRALVTLLNDLVIGIGGRIVAGTATLESGHLVFASGGKVQEYSTGIALQASGSGRVSATNGNAQLAFGTRRVSAEADGVLIVGNTLVQGDHSVTGAKSFIMEHPTKPGVLLRHGSTESPVSGIEYWGDVVIDKAGGAVVELPDYFEALAKPEGRSVFVTGRGFAADWSDIEGGSFTVTGVPGGRASWLVKAERFGGDFETEAPGNLEHGAA